MADFVPEPHFSHAQSPRIGVLLINLGTPKAPTSSALRPYLREFLSDRRVIEIPRLLWSVILNGFILTTRPAKSAKKYTSIWLPQGSPLAVHTQRQTEQLAQRFSATLPNVVVDYAMRYGQPAVETVIQRMRAAGVTQFLCVPLYPQYAASSSATALDAVFRTLMQLRSMPDVRTLRHFHDDAGYIAALAAKVQAHWAVQGRGDKLVMSFHGLPRRSLDLGDPYYCECHKTGRLLAEALGLTEDQYVVCFQSRFGRAAWLQPYTSEVLAALGRAGASIDVLCPGFVADCLETLEEIALEGKETFHLAGGQRFAYIPCLNDDAAWVDALADLCQRHLAGWETAATAPAELAARAERAKQRGAAQ